MALYALEDVDDALAATRAFLWPVDRSRWLKLALVVFFVGGPGAGFNTFQYNVPSGRNGPPGGPQWPLEVGPRAWAVVAAVVGILLLVGLVFLLVGSVMEFVLVESLREEAVTVRRFWGRRWRQGVRLFAFRVAIGVVVIGSVAVIAALVLLPVAVETGTGAVDPTPSIVALLFLIPVIAVLAVLVGLINGFTTAFVVPVMVLDDCGVLDGWRRLWPTIAADPWQYLAYAVAGFVLSLVGGVLLAIVVGVSALVLLIPFGVLAAIGIGLMMVIEPLGLGVLAVVSLLFGLSLLVVAAVVQVPIVAYLRYYALLVLGDVDTDLDLIPDRRATIRAEGDPSEGG